MFYTTVLLNSSSSIPPGQRGSVRTRQREGEIYIKGGKGGTKVSMKDLCSVPLPPFVGRGTNLTNGPESERIINLTSTRKGERKSHIPLVAFISEVGG